MKCINCGSENNENEKFCINCGKTFEKVNFNDIQNNFDNDNKENIRKVAIVVISILILIGIIYVGYKTLFSKNKKNEQEIAQFYKEDNPILITKNKKYGFVDSNGNIIAEPIYEKATTFHNGYAALGKYRDENCQYNCTTNYKMIDAKGNTKLDIGYAYEIKFNERGNVWVTTNSIYDINLNKIFETKEHIFPSGGGIFNYYDNQKQKEVFIDSKGKEFYSISADRNDSVTSEINSSSYDEDDSYIKISLGKKYNDSQNKFVIISLKTKKIVFEKTGNYSITGDKDGIYRYYELNGNGSTYVAFINGKKVYEVSDNTQTQVSDLKMIDYSNQIYEVEFREDYNIYRYYDAKNKKMLDNNPVEDLLNLKTDNPNLKIKSAINGYEIFEDQKVSNSYNKGLMKNNKIVVPAKYYDIKSIDNDLFNYLDKNYNIQPFMLRLENNIILMDIKNNKKLFEFDTYDLEENKESSFITSSNYSKAQKTIYNLISKKVRKFSYSAQIKYYSNYITVKENNITKYYNTNLEQIWSDE